MPRLYFCLRLIAVAVAFPVIAGYIAIAAAMNAVTRHSQRRGGLRFALRMWMDVCDWVRGIPVGYSYWEQYEAPVMLDEIAVHHEE